MVFRRHDGRSAEVEAGPLRMKVPLADIVGIESEQAPKPERRRCRATRGITVRAQPSDEPAGEEINVIGCTVEEATGRVDKFLDEAALAGKAERANHSWARHRRAAARTGGISVATHPLVEKIHHGSGRSRRNGDNGR